MIRVLIVDDHRLFRQGLSALLSTARDMQIVGEARDGKEGIEMAGQLQPDVILMDIEMPGVDGLEAARALLASRTNARIVFLSMRTDREGVQQAAQTGARGYLVKNCSRQELTQAIRNVFEGGVACSPDAVPFFSS